jgi:hypothetical protein
MTIGDGYGAAAMNADVKSPFRAGAKVLSVAIMVLLVIGARPTGHPGRRWVGRSITSSDILLSHYLSVLLGRGRSWSEESSWPPRSCWRVCMHLHRIGQLILWPHYAAQAGCWPRLCLLNSSVERGEGIVRVLGRANRAFSRGRQSADRLAYGQQFASPALHLVLGCGQIALFSRDAILDYTLAE